MFKKPFSDLTIALVCDNDLSRVSFECECNIIKLHLLDYKNILKDCKPDFVLVESVWGFLFYQIMDEINKKKRSKENLFDFCHQLNIPTVFWCKEDPTFHSQFINLASYFDYIFTIDKDCIFRYKNAHNNPKVYYLPHAVQSQIFNPTRTNLPKLNNIIFAGTWYTTMPQRCHDMQMILGSALKYGLHIYTRTYNSTGKSCLYPDMYKPYIKGIVDFKDMGDLYKRYNIALNVNTETKSSSYFSIRTYEILACGINLLSTHCNYLKHNLENIVDIVGTAKETDCKLQTTLNNNNLSYKKVVAGIRCAFTNNTYTDRIQTILSYLKLSKFKAPSKKVCILNFPNSQRDIDLAIENFKNQSYQIKQLIMLTTCKDYSLDNNTKKLNIHLIHFDKSDNINSILRDLINFSDFNYISFFSNDTIYAKHFINDLMLAFKYTYAQVIGKSSHYTYLNNKLNVYNPNISNPEYSYTSNLSTSSLIFKKNLLKNINMLYPPSSFLQECKIKKISMYSIDRFNLISKVHLTNYTLEKFKDAII